MIITLLSWVFLRSCSRNLITRWSRQCNWKQGKKITGLKYYDNKLLSSETWTLLIMPSLFYTITNRLNKEQLGKLETKKGRKRKTTKALR